MSKNQKIPTLTRNVAGPLIKSGKLRPAYLYETDKHGVRCVYVQLTPTLKRIYRYT